MNALGIIFSELHDKDIVELTRARTLASVPFGGRYRFIDFVLSSMVNSGITKVGVITKSNYQSLMDHVGSGKSWDLSRKNGGLIVLPPHGEGSGDGLFKTRFQALKSIFTFIKSSKEEYVVLSDCDNVCNIDLEAALETHQKNKADLTLVYREKYIKEGSAQKLVFDVDKNSVVQRSFFTASVGKYNAFTNIMIMSRNFLIYLLENSNVLQIKGFTNNVILDNPHSYKLCGHKIEGFYASVDSLSNYYRHSLELLEKDKRDSLFDASRPIFTKVRDSAPTTIGSAAKITNSMIADGCKIEGEVTNSILFRGVTVAKDAKIENSIIMQDTIISSGSKLNAVITDKNVVIKENRVLSGHSSLPYYVGKNTVI